MKKRILTLVLVSVMAVATMTGCAKKDYTNDAKAIISFDKSAEKISKDIDYKDADSIKSAAKKLRKKLDGLEVKTEEAKELKDDYEDVVKYYEDFAKLLGKYKDGDMSYSEVTEEMEKLREKMEKIMENAEEHCEDFYDACEDAKVDEDTLDDIEDELLDD